MGATIVQRKYEPEHHEWFPSRGRRSSEVFEFVSPFKVLGLTVKNWCPSARVSYRTNKSELRIKNRVSATFVAASTRLYRVDISF